jgi:alkyl sulfatase BDS1-like metallo-beta-lactamase superfamily hydrolase
MSARLVVTVVSLSLALAAAACRRAEEAPTAPAPAPGVGADARGHTAPSRATADANAAVARDLPLADAQDFADARRGLVASEKDLVIQSADGRRMLAASEDAFLDADAPASANPSLWRQSRLNAIHGLFQVTDGVHQVRGYDVSNMTLIEGRTGWIVVDPLTSRETAAAAIAFARRHLGERRVSALVFTHSHLDHFGGVDAVLPEGAPGDGVRIVAPKGFVEEATSENVLAGIAMGRRAAYMYGLGLPRGPRGHLSSGLGHAPVRGTIGIREPTDLVDRTPQEMELDGVRFVFQYAPESEAPAELAFYLPEKKAYCGAEIVSHNFHNLYTLRGAKVRDALKWSGYVDDAIQRFGDAEVVFASHHWPVWDNARVVDYLKKQRDVYKYVHDQTLRLANGGATPQEIAEQLVLPESLRTTFAVRDYYGTVRHNAKAVYQMYFGWFDGNPANLDPLPPAEAAARYVEAMGGAAEALRKTREAVERGDYRWAAMLGNHLVFADPGNAEAREALASAYDQLGYQAESGPWRDFYLSGAADLRHGVTTPPLNIASAAELLRHLSAERFFDSMASRLDGPKADGKTMVLNFTFTDLGENHVVTLENAVLHHRRAEPAPDAAATVKLTRDFLVRLVTGQAGLREMIFSDELSVEGSRLDLLSFFSLLERQDGRFPIVTP